MIRRWHSAVSFGCAMLCVMPAMARELLVGPSRALMKPSEAAGMVADGDVVRIDPGTYRDCAVWRASRLVIEAAGPGVRIGGTTCAEKGIFVTEGSDITVRGITFANASVRWHNGAGIRAAGDNLTVERSRFLNNENGILAGGSGSSVLRVIDSVFVGNGACIDACAHGVYAGEAIRLLDVEQCVFEDTKTAHHIKSRARNTIVRNSTIEDGPAGTSSYLIDVPNGGNVLIEGNIMQKGPHSSNAAVAVSLGIEGVEYKTESLIIRGNQFRNDTGARTVFVRNATGVSVVTGDNVMTGSVDLVVDQRPSARR